LRLNLTGGFEVRRPKRHRLGLPSKLAMRLTDSAA
jgi:hypothetical protein